MSEMSQVSQPTDELSLGGKLPVLALSTMALAVGWMIVLSGGFMTESYRRSGVYTLVDGEVALIVAVIQFLAAAIGVAALLKSSDYSRTTVWLSIATVMVPPMGIALAA